MAEVLSQNEIDSLLTAISAGEMNIEEAKNIEDEKKVKLYDFKRPDKLSKDQLRTLQMIHETFARLNTNMLSAQLRAAVQIQVISVEQITYQEFIRSIPEFTILGIFDTGSLEGNAIIELNPSIVFTIIDRLFGGPGETTDLARELTDIEMTVIERMILKMLNNLRESWNTVVQISPRIEQIETNPQFVQIVGPNEMVVLMTFEVKLGTSEGMMNVCIPYPVIEPVVSKLSAQYWFASVRKEHTDENLEALRQKISRTYLPFIAQLGLRDLVLDDILRLKKGDVIDLRKATDKDLDVIVGNKRKFTGTPGMLGNKLAVEIKTVIEEKEDE